MTFNATSGLFSGPPKASSRGSYLITITAKNSTGTFIQLLTINVT